MKNQEPNPKPEGACEQQGEAVLESSALFAVDCWAYGPVEEPTVSKALAENRVVKITPTEDGKFKVLEMCDEHFGATLTTEQLAAWGRELVALSSANVLNERPDGQDGGDGQNYED